MFSYTSQNALLLESKADMKKRGVPSPDIADAFALTFAYPVSGAVDEPEQTEQPVGRCRVTGY